MKSLNLNILKLFYGKEMKKGGVSPWVVFVIMVIILIIISFLIGLFLNIRP